MNATVLPRGVRNNNPLNIRHEPGTVWIGQADEQTDPDFVQFRDPVFGVRAGAIILREYKLRDNIDTIAEAIYRWSATDQEAYTANVAADCNVSPTAQIDLEQYLPVMIPAMIKQECDDYVYPEMVITNGIASSHGPVR
jgi:hypothetical protein